MEIDQTRGESANVFEETTNTSFSMLEEDRKQGYQYSEGKE